MTADGSQVCVDGLKHGGRYAVVLREGDGPGDWARTAARAQVAFR